ncbi:EAL domain-containing protein [Raoultella ornithinolytica]|uniref:EAL domain-containing protein n=1 Tax=Raoultella ornithinolytica TaxID=54291 RepID=UPI001A20081E|nr:EAL domain-containing protein [Raoultella ornithinolytica]ELS5400752.1 EAL domain-containing protein [Raoultella ornithinolytica]ELS5455535.1 EAL domain-containing protein [Raoultella ornithinolytica]ELS5479855.1 EAL domain-containing protein [Raoultella ornithinolytica]MDV1389533.1 EAL domain-containing protein [Raoultella ornithinolytica]ULI43283.1 EAL domain-containing protein [Raoultella ornithinolytica]
MFETRLMSDLEFYRRKFCRAMSHDEIFPYYQPVINVDSGTVYGLEVLARWQGKNGVVYSPAIFFSHLEKYGLEQKLSEFLMQCVANDITKLCALLPHGIHLTMNFSVATLQTPGFINTYLSFISRFPTGRYVFVVELTETQALNKAAISTLQRLKLANVKIFLDDFGIRHSNLNYLLLLDIDGLKLDKCFAENYLSVKGNKVIEGILTLARSLNVEVVVEGVEVKSQSEYFYARGVFHQQGFLHAKPMSCEDLKVYMESSFIKKTQ